MPIFVPQLNEDYEAAGTESAGFLSTILSNFPQSDAQTANRN
jgi:hypothetical protein